MAPPWRERKWFLAGEPLKLAGMSENNSVDLFNLSKCQVLDQNGAQIELGQLWKSSKAVLIFLRHFACIACRAHATQVWAHREVYERNNTRVFFIGNGAPQFIEGFRQDLDLGDAPIYTDPTLVAFRFCGFKRGFLNIVKPKTVINATKLHLEGHRQTQLQAQGDHWQLGGVVVVTPENQVVFHFISEALGDFPPEKDVAGA
jgi:peroxiredoxin